MSRWDGIYEFIQVVERGSFTAAAETLGLSTSQVSKLVSKLEDRLAARLLIRTTRRINLTEEGQQFYLRCRQAVDAFDRAEQDVAQSHNEPTGRLRVAISGCFQERFVVPVLSEFTLKYRRIQMNVDFCDSNPDIIRSGHDMAICYGELDDSTLVARKIADNFNYLVASPDYLDGRGTPATPDDLSEHNCLTGISPVWYLSDGQETLQLKISGNWHSDNGAALLSAARSGVGIANLPFFSVQEDISRGELVQLLPNWSKYPEPVWILYPSRRHLTLKVRLLIDFLLDQLQQVEL